MGGSDSDYSWEVGFVVGSFYEKTVVGVIVVVALVVGVGLGRRSVVSDRAGLTGSGEEIYDQVTGQLYEAIGLAKERGEYRCCIEPPCMVCCVEEQVILRVTLRGCRV